MARTTYANVTATAALVLALGGTAYAGTLVTSADIKDGTIQTRDLSGPTQSKIVTTRTGIAGPGGGQNKEVMDLALPAGKWVVVAHLGGAHNDVDSSTRIECALTSPGGQVDYAKIRLPANDNPTDALVFFDYTLSGAVSLAASGQVNVVCGNISVGDTGITFTSHSMTAIRGHTRTVQ